MKTIKYFLALVITSITFLSTAQITTKQPLTVAVSQTNPSCNGMNNGEITLTIDGGVQPYIVNGIEISTTTYTMASLTSGVYDFVIYDSYNGGASGAITLTDPVAPTISYVIGNETNSDENGLIELTVSPAPLSFEWQSLTSTVLTNPNEEDQYNLSAGWYDVVITDNNGCEYIKRFNVQQYIAPLSNDNFITDGEELNNTSMMMINGVLNNNTTRSNRNLIYPNPSSGNINLKNNGETYKIFSLTNGEMISSTESNIDLKIGTYLVYLNGTSEKVVIR